MRGMKEAVLLEALKEAGIEKVGERLALIKKASQPSA
jgi:hypothetical protein